MSKKGELGFRSRETSEGTADAGRGPSKGEEENEVAESIRSLVTEYLGTNS